MKKYPVSTIFLLIAGLLILPFLVLSFFARPSSDDLFLHYLVQHYGFGFTREYLGDVISSRFFSLPLLLIFCSSHISLSNYFIFPLSYFSAYLFASWILARTINRRLLANQVNKTGEAALTMLSLLLFLLIIPDTASGFYWISGTATHTTPAIALLLFTTCYIEILMGHRRWLFTVLATLTILVITGSSELLTLGLLWLLSLAVHYQYRTSGPCLTHTSLLLTAVLIGAAFLFLGAGNMSRAGHFQPSGWGYALSGALYTYFSVWGRILANPFIYVCAFSVLFMLPAGKPIDILGKGSWIIFWLAVPFVLYALPIYFNSSGVPPRASNPISLFLVICMFACLYQYRNLIQVPISPGLVFIASLMLVANIRFERSWENIFSGYFYSKVYDERLTLIREARKNGLHAIALEGYVKAWNGKVTEKITPAYLPPVRKLVSPTPELIHFSDDLYHTYWGESYAEYYGIDTIRCENFQHIRFSLSDRGKAFARDLSDRYRANPK